MNQPPFETGPIRPVDERDSLLIRTTRGCPWNRCAFCVNYHDMPFSMRSSDEIKRDIAAAADYYGTRVFTSCFLQDGDSFIMKTGDLIEILECLKRYFPTLERISSYGRAQTLIRRSPEEIRQICEAGLNKLYCGMESGSDTVLKKVNKGAIAADIIRSGLTAKECGMQISEFIILGLGGRELWREHAIETARVLNAINPHFIRVLTIGVKEGSDLKKQMLEGTWLLQSEKNLIEEQRLLIASLDGITSSYVNHHAVDLLLEARGQFPDDKTKLLAIMDRYLALPENEQHNFTLGRRLGFYQKLDDLQDVKTHSVVEARLSELMRTHPDRLDDVFHIIREQIV
ncbi:MAG: radical SAM protein [Desulfuromonadaceae bacterium]|nr:radical SAM protein [Desulfuromonadaceae bacterium]MDD5106832.1 radical SAM protein [Desulfuromonadaceae bacterium]